MRDLRGMGPDTRERSSFSKTPMRVLLCVDGVLAVALVALRLMGGADTLFLYYWVYLALVAAGFTVLLAMGVLGIGHRVRRDKLRTRVWIVLGSLVLCVALTLGSMIYTWAMFGERPFAYFRSPEGGNRLVVMIMAEDYMTAYPMTSEYFYRPTFEDGIHVASPVIDVSWDDEDVARVRFGDLAEDEDRQEIVVRFAAEPEA